MADVTLLKVAQRLSANDVVQDALARFPATEAGQKAELEAAAGNAMFDIIFHRHALKAAEERLDAAQRGLDAGGYVPSLKHILLRATRGPNLERSL